MPFPKAVSGEIFPAPTFVRVAIAHHNAEP